MGDYNGINGFEEAVWIDWNSIKARLGLSIE